MTPICTELQLKNNFTKAVKVFTQWKKQNNYNLLKSLKNVQFLVRHADTHSPTHDQKTAHVSMTLPFAPHLKPVAQKEKRSDFSSNTSSSPLEMHAWQFDSRTNVDIKVSVDEYVIRYK